MPLIGDVLDRQPKSGRLCTDPSEIVEPEVKQSEARHLLRVRSVDEPWSGMTDRPIKRQAKQHTKERPGIRFGRCHCMPSRHILRPIAVEPASRGSRQFRVDAGGGAEQLEAGKGLAVAEELSATMHLPPLLPKTSVHGSRTAASRATSNRAKVAPKRPKSTLTPTSTWQETRNGGAVLRLTAAAGAIWLYSKVST